ncbi:MAG: flavodoxin [Bacteroidaceae bacterium]|nr:flavodoxin [Bacteroidaceae bacterium]
MKLTSTICAALLSFCTACTAQSGQPTTTMNNAGKSLVLFFSHAGENYNVGHIDVGNTKIVADYISEQTGADQFEIVCQKNYDMPYMKLIEIAKDEAQRGELPPYVGDIDTAPYDTIFIGGPIWWGTFPQVMFTFFGAHDLSGKTIVPFVTHEGSGLASTVSDLKRAYPQANVLPGFAIYGHEVRSGRAKVEKWLHSLGY